MTRYLESGMRRDCCALLHGRGEVRAQELKRWLSDYYESRLDPQQFYERLDALVDAGHVEKRVDGVHDVYALTDGGARILEGHVRWLNEQVGDKE